MRTARDIGEFGLIRRLQRYAATPANVIVGIGDDCAVVRAGTAAEGDLLLTSDAVIEGVHFAKGTAGEAIGHKAAGRVLSDIAAMGGEPLWMLADLVLPADTPVAAVEGIYRGASRLARKYGMAIVGGDTAGGPGLEIHAFGVGRVPRGTAVLRSGARRGDALYATGRLGGSLAGRHLRFEPRVAEGEWLREGRWASSMIDISDGLASDVRHIMERSGVGVLLDLANVPVSRAARGAAAGRDPLEHALYDGEDFELLFTVTARRQAAFERAWRERFRLACTRIGSVTSRRGKLESLTPEGRAVQIGRGYEHFRG